MNSDITETDRLLRLHLHTSNVTSPPSWSLSPSPVGGRGLFATRDLLAGDRVLVDAPLVVGPRVADLLAPICVGCHRTGGTLVACRRGCGLPVCDVECGDKEGHVEECGRLVAWRPRLEAGTWSHGLLKALTPVRCLSLSDDQRDLVRCLEAHRGRQHEHEVDLLKSQVGVAPSSVDEELMRTCCCAMDANAFEVTVQVAADPDAPKTSMRGLYPLAAMMNHECTPNTRHGYDKELHMIVTATVAIPQGSEITTSYFTLLWGTSARRHHLFKTKHFLCHCARCRDPQEGGSRLSALKCAAADCPGSLLSEDPVRAGSRWSCDTCALRLRDKEALHIQSCLGAVLRGVRCDDPVQVAAVLRGHRRIFATSNQVVVELKTCLVWILGHYPGFLWQDLSDDDLSRKEELCRELLRLLELLKAGQCRLKALFLFELHCTLAEQQRRVPNNQLEETYKMEPTVMIDAHGNSFWVIKTFMQPEINLDPASDPLALDVKPTEPSSVKLEPGTEPDPMNNVTQLETTSVKQETDPLAFDAKPDPELLEVKQESVLPWVGTDPLDNITDNNTPRTPRSPPRFVPLNSSTRQARSIEPSALNITTEPPSVMQDSLPQGILPDSRSAEDQSSSVLNETPQPAVARSDSTDNQVFDSVSSPCRSDCVDSESRDDDSIQLTSDTSLAVKYNLKQCSVSLIRLSLSSTHTASGIVSDRSLFQSTIKEQPSTSHGLKRPRKTQKKSNSTSKKFRCMVCPKTFNTKAERADHHRVIHMNDCSCVICGDTFTTAYALKGHMSNKHSSTPLSCSICNKIFSSKGAVRYHVKYTHNRIDVTCSVCGKLFAESYYAQHLKAHYKGDYECDNCGKTFAKKSKLTVHVLIHLNIRDHVCQICAKSFKRKYHLNIHLLAHSNVRDRKCQLCGKLYKSENDLKDHMRTHNKEYKCGKCDKLFSTKPRLKDHMLQHLDVHDCKCDVCGKSFVSSVRLSSHKRIHVMPRYPCSECDKSYCNKYVLRQHMSSVHQGPSDGSGFPCSSCGKVFALKEDLMSHLKTHGLFCVSCDLICPDDASMRAHAIDVHGGERKYYSCKTCDKQFNSREKLTKHEKIHIKTPFQCSFCHKTFVKKRALDLHSKDKHSVKYSCDVCRKSFTCEEYMKKHRKSHSKRVQCDTCKITLCTKAGLRRHISEQHSTESVHKVSCSICSRSFHSMPRLKEHQLSHTKPFVCDELKCSKSFCSKLFLLQHQEVHITEKIHKCDVCSKSFGLISSLIVHKRQHRPN